MNDKCDQLAKALARSITRRAALKTFGIGLGVVTLTLMTFTPVLGGNRAATLRYSAKLLPIGDERHASGVVKMTLTRELTYGTYNGSVSSNGLTPGASYELLGGNNFRDFAFGIRVADTQGTVPFGFSGVYGDWQGASYPTRFEVYRIEPTGNVLVLSGEI